jgi:hypothetical protein
LAQAGPGEDRGPDDVYRGPVRVLGTGAADGSRRDLLGLFYKAKNLSLKDQTDFTAALPILTQTKRSNASMASTHGKTGSPGSGSGQRTALDQSPRDRHSDSS